MATRFFKSNQTGDIIQLVVGENNELSCQGHKMVELKANTQDAATEKHVPVVTRLDENTIKVEVGSVPHPMTPEHSINFIYVETEKGGIRVDLADTDKPEAVVYVGSEKVIAVYEYCNLHGLWKTEL